MILKNPPPPSPPPENNNMNIFHTNINGLESKLDNLHQFISGSQPKLDILAITETSEQEKVGFLHNVEIKGYKIFHTASKMLMKMSTQSNVLI